MNTDVAERLQRYATLREPMPKPQSELPRVLNASHATSIVVGIIIGSGIFLVPREMMAAVGSSSTVYAVWIVGGPRGAAAKLGVKRTTLLAKMRRLDISRSILQEGTSVP